MQQTRSKQKKDSTRCTCSCDCRVITYGLKCSACTYGMHK